MSVWNSRQQVWFVHTVPSGETSVTISDANTGIISIAAKQMCKPLLLTTTSLRMVTREYKVQIVNLCIIEASTT